ncbi:MAG: SpoVG family protein [Ruminococcus flavefaciens]|nr:SpoVG family protein [Ruminococcus flavefaciens]MCM1380754.1 SpoVG family protein [Muribaculaceae bacterium]MCM1479398.1 SpoVG family protein [Muribaculaceae bacterium]
MIITSVKVFLLPNSTNKVRAIASIVLDGMFAINDIKILYANDRYFLAMPSKPKKEGGFFDIAHPISEHVRKLVETVVMYAYNMAIEKNASKIELRTAENSADSVYIDLNNYKIIVEHESKEPPRVHKTEKKSTQQSQDDSWQKWFNS